MTSKSIYVTKSSIFVVNVMTKYKVGIKGKNYEFSFEEENLGAFKNGLQSFISLVKEFEKPTARMASNVKRRGGRRPPFIKTPILELMKKEPEWFADKFPENVTEKLKTQYGVVGAKTESVNVALVRLFQNGLLTRKEMQGKYAYSVLSVPR